MSANTRPLEQSLQEGSPEMIHYQVYVALSKEKIIALEAETHGQSDDILWFMERKRITASIVKRVACRFERTSPEKLVESIVYRRSFFSVATAYGQETEDVARQAYIKLMRLTKPALTVRKVGLCVSVSQPWLAGSLDGAVQDPSEAEEGLLEIKCLS